MERRDAGVNWMGKVVLERTYEENLQRLAEARGLERSAQWLTRHGEAGAETPVPPRLLLRGVRGLTSDGRPHWLDNLKAGLHKVW